MAITYVRKKSTKKVTNDLKEKFEDPEINPLSETNEFERIHVKVDSNETLESFKKRLLKIDGVEKSTIVEETFKIPVVSKKVLWVILFGLVGSLITFSYFSIYPITVEDATTRFELFTNTEALSLEILFAIAITIWLLFREKRWQRGVSDALIELQITTSEIKQYVKSINEKLDKKN